MVTQVPKRVLGNGMVVLVRELNIKENGNSLSWFDYGAMYRRVGINPCKMIPKYLNEKLSQGQATDDAELVVNTLLKIGDFLSGWIWAQMNQKTEEKQDGAG